MKIFSNLSRTAVRLAALALALSASAYQPARASEVESAGEVLRIALPLAAGGIALFREDHDGLLQLGMSEAASFGTAYLLQAVIDKQRPDGSDWDAFPSDSTAVAFSAAAFLERRYGWNYGLPAYALAGFVAYSRVDADKHDWADVAAGAAIGWAFSALLTSPYGGNIRIAAVPSYAGRTATPGFRVHMIW